MADPVAWNMIESGWKVFDAEGEEIGTVHEVTGDENADIFDGLAIKQGFSARTSTSRRSTSRQIVEGEVHLSLTRRTDRGARDVHGADGGADHPGEARRGTSAWHGSGSPAVNGERRARVRVRARPGGARARTRGLAGRADRALSRADRAARPAVERVRDRRRRAGGGARRGRSTAFRSRSRI